MTDNAFAGAYTRAMQRCGVEVLIQRQNGNAPHTSTVSARVLAVVRDALPDIRQVSRSGYGSGEPGGITQDDREIIVLAADLAAARFPMPIVKNDTVVLVSTGDRFNVISVDAGKRELGGAIELKASGVS